MESGNLGTCADKTFEFYIWTDITTTTETDKDLGIYTFSGDCLIDTVTTELVNEDGSPIPNDKFEFISSTNSLRIKAVDASEAGIYYLHYKNTLPDD